MKMTTILPASVLTYWYQPSRKNIGQHLKAGARSLFSNDRTWTHRSEICMETPKREMSHSDNPVGEIERKGKHHRNLLNFG